MNKWVTTVTLMLLAATLMGAASAASGGIPVTDFGGDRNRNHYSAEPWGYPMCAAWAVDLGRSASQPLSIGDRIYHLAGDSLWALRKVDELPPNLSNEEAKKALVVWQKSGLQQEPSRSHPTYSDGTGQSADGRLYQGLIYAGTGITAAGTSALIVVAAEDGTVLGQFDLPAEIVSAPLVFPDDHVVFGTTDGRVWVIKGLASATVITPRVDTRLLEGRVSSSPVPVGPDRFVIGADGTPHGGKVMAYNLALHPIWTEPFYTPAGVPASFAADDRGIVYFSDKTGVFYAVDGRTGVKIWSAISPFADTFLNNSPAVDADHIYFTIRRGDGEGHLIAFPRRARDINTPVWTATLPSNGNTAPLVWGDGQIVLVGDMSGKISGWKTTTGEPAPYATHLTCRDAGHRRTFWQHIGGTGREDLHTAISLVDNPYRHGIGWSQASGAGTELTLTGGLLLAGANGLNQDVFLAFSHGGQIDLKLTGEVLVPDQPPKPGDRLSVRLQIHHQHGFNARKTVIAHGWMNEAPRFEFVDIPIGYTGALQVQTPPVPDSGETARYMAIINPYFYDFYARRGVNGANLEPLPAAWEASMYGLDGLPDYAERGLAALDARNETVLYELLAGNNAWTQTIGLDHKNLAFEALYAPSRIPAPEPGSHPTYQVTAVIHSNGSEPVQTLIRYTVHSTAMRGGSLEQTITVPPGTSRHSFTLPGSNPHDTIRVVGNLNPSRTVAESDYDDNTATAITVVDGRPIPPTPPDAGKVDDILLR